MDASLVNNVGVHRLIESTLRAAGVANVRRIEVPDGTGTPGSVFLEDSSTTRAAAQALKSVPGVTRVRRRRHLSQELLFQVAPAPES
jgi:hypothetical protein